MGQKTKRVTRVVHHVSFCTLAWNEEEPLPRTQKAKKRARVSLYVERRWAGNFGLKTQMLAQKNWTPYAVEAFEFGFFNVEPCLKIIDGDMKYKL